MTMRMLIDARHREETRVAVVKGSRIEEFDFESAERKQLKGNIYLAKVTRVEPSLQAAFVDYGGNRHGFLAFSEIHPDYYQIPKEDREALLREEAEHAAEEERLRASEHDDEDDAEGDADGFHADDAGDDSDFNDEDEGVAPRPVDVHADEGDEDEVDEGEEEAPRPRKKQSVGGDDHAVENLRQKRMNLRRRYKIQDVIRRRQVLLVQVVKEERGNKGAALTTYLSLAGRYCVLMPNTSHGGGISRKISNGADRKRLKSIMAELALPSTMGCIVRTAGLQRTKNEIKRDFDYLARLWDEIRETTMGSAAPALIYGDSDLIKRAIRDIYNKDIDEVIVEGEEGYRQARQYMKLLMPAAVKKVKCYIDTVPLFQRGGVEDQLAAMYQPVVQLKSGGYIVINPTEALVSIDINSGRSTREHNIEQTALSTNLEAAHEIARQLRLRDMAGLVVIDFIDMESNSNNRKVERAMKEALKNDRARIQVGRISSFGLFEMSRQRLRTGVLEASTRTCPHCEGTGLVRTASSAGLSALRMLEEEAARGRGSQLRLRASQEAAFYVLNRKRGELAEIEERYGVSIEILPDGSMEGARMTVEAGGPPPIAAPRLPVAPPVDDFEDDYVEEVEDEVEEDEEELVAEDEAPRERSDRRDEGEDRGGRRRRRRRRRGGRREEGELGADIAESEQAGEAEVDAEAADEAGEAEVQPETAAGDEPGTDEGEGRRRRGRRGRRGRRRDGGAVAAGDSEPAAEADAQALNEEAAPPAVEPEPVVAAEPAPEAEPVAAAPEAVEVAAEAPPAEPAPRARRRPRARAAEPVAEVAALPADEPLAADAALAAAPVEQPAEAAAPEKPKRTRKRKADAEAPAAATPEPAAAEAEPAATPAKRTRRRKADTAPAEAAVEAPAPEPVAVAPAEEVATPDAQPAADAQASGDAEEAGAPPRRGWWQRTFGA
ncbi:Rne/Rng family ribonuclease [Sphingomonas jatrophae]|uniref:Ribonuclease E n=2 Tax=Pseudomonadota TaxID=1224 RepID=A0A1I6JPU2_9SPHN|nr:ribonuclease E/G [Sphingomonas jatrophae]SFR80963.1 ribonuclease E [Sphingomonas jatrophae]